MTLNLPDTNECLKCEWRISNKLNLPIEDDDFCIREFNDGVCESHINQLLDKFPDLKRSENA